MREDWIECSLLDVCDIHDSLRKPINTKERNKRIEGKNKNELFPYYGATGQVGFTDDFLTNGDYILIGEDAAPFLDYTKDVAYKISGKTWVNNHAHILKSKLNNDFLLHYLNNFNYNGYVSGTTRLKLTQSRLKQIPIKIAPLPVQRAIVSKIETLFSDLDDGIASLKKAEAQLKIYRQAVLKKAFEGEYNICLLKDLANIMGGVTKGRKLEGKATTELPYLRVANVQDGFLDLSIIKYIKVLVTDLEKYRLIEGDVLFTEGGDRDKLGRGTVWKNEVTNCIHQNHIFRARIKDEDELNPYFLTYFAQSPTGKNFFFKNGKHTTNLASINKTILSNLPVPIPSIQKQKKIIQGIETRLSVCDQVEQSIKESLEKAKALRQSILKKAFEGRLLSSAEIEQCKREHDYEPASVLLEKIKAEKIEKEQELKRTKTKTQKRKRKSI